MGAIRDGCTIGLAALMLAGSVPASAARRHDPPYWASLSTSAAMLRAGPGTNFPATWRYVRPDLPVRVVQLHEDWRRVVDPAGVEGWMRSNLLSEERTALVIGEVRTLRAAPDTNAKIIWRVEPGVVGKIRHCAAGWCEFNVHGRAGYIETNGLWGVEPDEVVD